MTYKEEIKDLFSVNFSEYTPVHCVSFDCKMGAGIAVPMKEKFNLQGLKSYLTLDLSLDKFIPIAIFYNGVINLITKRNYWEQPTYEDFIESIETLRELVAIRGIKKLVMPTIGCGIDGLNWVRVRSILCDHLEQFNIEVLVCKLK